MFAICEGLQQPIGFLAVKVVPILLANVETGLFAVLGIGFIGLFLGHGRKPVCGLPLFEVVQHHGGVFLDVLILEVMRFAHEPRHYLLLYVFGCGSSAVIGL